MLRGLRCRVLVVIGSPPVGAEGRGGGCGPVGDAGQGPRAAAGAADERGFGEAVAGVNVGLDDVAGAAVDDEGGGDSHRAVIAAGETVDLVAPTLIAVWNVAQGEVWVQLEPLPVADTHNTVCAWTRLSENNSIIAKVEMQNRTSFLMIILLQMDLVGKLTVGKVGERKRQ